MKHEHYWRLYDFEWQLRERLTSWLQVPTGVMTLIGGGGVVLASKFPYAHDARTLVFLVFFVTSVGFLVLGASFIARSFHGYRYDKLSRPDELRDFYLKLVQFHKDSGHSQATADVDFEDFLNRRLAQATTLNAENNARKSRFLHLATAMTLAALFFLGCSAVPFLLASSQSISTQSVVPAANQPKEHRNDESPTRASTGEESSAQGAGGAQGTGASPGAQKRINP